MKSILPGLAVTLLLIFPAACGKKGLLLPPLVLVPQSAQDVALFQRGSHIYLEWKNPDSYLDGTPLEGLSGVEVWLLDQVLPSEAGEARPVTMEDFRRDAGLEAFLPQAEIPQAPRRPGEIITFIKPVRESDIDSKAFIFSLRVLDGKGRKSEYSAPVMLIPRPLPQPPRGLQAVVSEDRIELSWTAPDADIKGSTPANITGYRLLRSEGEGVFLPLAEQPFPATSTEDRDFLFGKTYRYVVRAASRPDPPFGESEDSEPVEVTPLDVFPPEPPAELASFRGAGYITLVWTQNRETDLAGYRVWRKEAGKPKFILLTPEVLLETTYTDNAVEKNKRYEYAITAEDEAGNRSSFSESVIESIMEGRK